MTGAAVGPPGEGLAPAEDGPAPASRPAPPVGLYIHIPFCVSLCPYCDFVVVAGAAARGPRNRITPFLAALHAELDLRADAADAAFGRPGTDGSGRPDAAGLGRPDAASAPTRQPLETVYLGGGTPSLLPGDAVAELLGHVAARFGLATGAEITLEANPGPDERGDPVALRAAGVTRISYGAQSLDEGELKRLGRRHAPTDVAAAVAGARAAGGLGINLDLLYDIPETHVETWAATLERALELAPDHLSLYALTLDDPDAEGLTGPLGDHLPTTPGARRWRERAVAQQDEDQAAAAYHHAVERLAAAGWRGYEISNWARPGAESRHNLAYWERRPYEAIGPGAHAFDGVTRRWNAARLDRYLAALAPEARDGDDDRPRLPPGGSEAIDAQMATAETVILGLRMDRGLARAFADRPPLAGSFAWARANDLLEITPDGRIVLTTRGRLLSNELFARLVG